MWASNLHLPLCLSKRGTRPEFVNRRGGTSKREGEGEKTHTQGWGGGGCHLSPPPAHCLVSREMSTFTAS